MTHGLSRANKSVALTKGVAGPLLFHGGLKHLDSFLGSGPKDGTLKVERPTMHATLQTCCL